MKLKTLFAIIALLLNLSVIANTLTPVEKGASDYFNGIQQNPTALYQFLYAMPKGGDLHSHISGAAYAENLISYGHQDPYCINRENLAVANATNCEAAQKVANAQNNNQLYNSLIDAWSMYNFVPGKETREDHFFNTFGKFGLLVTKHPGAVLAEIVSRAASQNVSYLELYLTAHNLDIFGKDGEIASAIGRKVGWDNDLIRLREKLLTQGLRAAIDPIPARLNAMEADMRKRLNCGTVHAAAGCKVTVRYQYTALRGLPPQELFAQLVTAFESAQLDKRIVGINIVQAEDGPIATRDYTLQMHMLETLHKLYPRVHISLHAGELAADSVAPETLRFHIRQAVEIGQAQRIGHGVDIGYEDDSEGLFAKMAKQQIMVEINLTSNDSLLGIHGKAHPFPLYLKHQVPVSLSTDDEGIFRTFITREYQRAVHDYHLNYPTLKMLARNSLSYSFIPGANLWQKANSQGIVKPCAHDNIGAKNPTQACAQFLAASEKAQLQWQLEQQFKDFEATISQRFALKK